MSRVALIAVLMASLRLGGGTGAALLLLVPLGEAPSSPSGCLVDDCLLLAKGSWASCDWVEPREEASSDICLRLEEMAKGAQLANCWGEDSA